MMCFILSRKTVEMLSLPTAMSDVFHEPMSFRFHTSLLSLGIPESICGSAACTQKSREQVDSIRAAVQATLSAQSHLLQMV